MYIYIHQDEEAESSLTEPKLRTSSICSGRQIIWWKKLKLSHLIRTQNLEQKNASHQRDQLAQQIFESVKFWDPLFVGIKVNLGTLCEH